MNFKKFLLESEEIPDWINKQCPEWAEEAGDNYLYRGIRWYTEEIKLYHENKDRKPLALGQHLQDLFNKAFEEVNGVKDIRSRAAFCTGNKPRTAIFGTPHIIVAKSPYEYWWSESIKDLNNSTALLGGLEDLFWKTPSSTLEFNVWREARRPKEFDKHAYPFIVEFITDANYKNTYLADAIKSKAEVMLLGDYYAIKSDS